MSNTTAKKTTKFRFYSYDVWGNEKDGFEVNNVFSTPFIYEIPAIINNNKGLFTMLKKQQFFKKGIHRSSVEIDWENEDIIYFNFKGKPEGELRRIGA